MQTSQLQDLDTHVVLGGGELEEFNMAGSAEAFTVLSDTLYQDKPRACVREVLCNAWDAHIKAGKRHVPVEVTLTADELTISDQGPGIPHDQVRVVYCTFFNSTKVQDETQTGGFGLGSKAPYAVADHFTSTISHGGRRIAYAMSRGGTETGGKPGFRAMVDTPTISTGVTVTIPLMADRMSVAQARDLVRELAWQGGMNVTLNGNQIGTPDFSEAQKTGYAVLNHPSLSDAQLYVAYGAVMYPVRTSVKEIEKAVKDIDYQLNGTRHGNWGYPTLVLFTEPNTIGVTPSRESLSFTERTQRTILGRLSKVSRDVDRFSASELADMLEAAVRRRMAKQPEVNVLRQYHPIPDEIQGQAMTPRRVAACFARHAYTNEGGNRRSVKRAMIRVFPDLRRPLRRDSNLGRVHNRPIIRLASDLGLLPRLYSFEPRINGFTKIGRSKEWLERHLFVAPTQLSATEAAGRDFQSYGRFYPALIIPQLTDDHRRRISMWAFDNGYTVTFAERVKPEAKARAAIPAQFMSVCTHQPVSDLTGLQAFVKAKHYQKEGWQHCLVSRKSQELASGLFEDVIRAGNASEVKYLKKQGLRDIEDLIFEQAKSNISSRALLWGYAVTFSSRYTRLDRIWPHADGRVKEILEGNPDLVGFFYPKPVFRAKNAQEMISLGRLVGSMAASEDLTALLDNQLRKNPFVTEKLPDPADEFLYCINRYSFEPWKGAILEGTLAGIRALRSAAPKKA